MNSTDFNALDLNQKANILWDKGDYLDIAIDYYNHKVLLYILFDDFVEVYINILSNEIELIQAIRRDDLQKYLNRIQTNIK